MDPSPKDSQTSRQQDPPTTKTEKKVPKVSEQEEKQKQAAKIRQAALQQLHDTERLTNERTKELERAEPIKLQAENDIRLNSMKATELKAAIAKQDDVINQKNPRTSIGFRPK